jgi:hypothetical protein
VQVALSQILRPADELIPGFGLPGAGAEAEGGDDEAGGAHEVAQLRPGTPGSPSPLRPRWPPSLPSIRMTSRRVSACAAGGSALVTRRSLPALTCATNARIVACSKPPNNWPSRRPRRSTQRAAIGRARKRRIDCSTTRRRVHRGFSNRIGRRPRSAWPAVVAPCWSCRIRYFSRTARM